MFAALFAASLLLPLLPARAVVHDFSDLGGQPYNVTWDARSLRLNDEPVLLQSGSIHYPRSTPEMWPRLFAEARTNGLNAISSYVFWSVHARTFNTSEYNYTGIGDVRLFLQLARDADLFVLWRIGPYICAEWPGGGIPDWIHEVPDMKTRTLNQPWMDQVQRWMTDHLEYIVDFLPRNGGNVILSQVENEYSGSSSDPDAVAYVNWLGALTQKLAPDLVWVMCGHVALVANETVHTGNGCPHDQSIPGHVTPGLAGDPDMYTEDEQWFDPWGLPNVARTAVDVSYGAGSYMVTGGSMHNYYMWFGGNHYANWSVDTTADTDDLVPQAASSKDNTVRYANSAALHSDGTRNEPLFTHLGTLHWVLRRFAAAMLTHAPTKTALDCDDASPTACTTEQYALTWPCNDSTGDQPPCNVSFILNNAAEGHDVLVNLSAALPKPWGDDPTWLPFQSLFVVWNGTDKLYNSTDTSAAPNASAEIVCDDAATRTWTTWTDDSGGTWSLADFDVPAAATNASLLLDLHGLGEGLVFLDDTHVTNFKVSSAIANCSVTRKDRCGSRQVNVSGTMTGTFIAPNAPGDGGCDEPSQRYYHVPPELAAGATTMLIGDSWAGTNASLVRICTRDFVP